MKPLKNVMIYLTPGTEATTLTNLAAHLNLGGLFVAAFELTAAAGLLPVAC